MQLVDFNQVAISNLFVDRGFGAPTDESLKLDEGMIRHMVLNSLRSYRMKYGKKYGKLVICIDDRHYWRKEIFPHYKANRKKNREDSAIDWNLVFETINKLRDELKTYLPYRVLNIAGAEADDIIGVIAKAEHTIENVLILSGDKDFVQLQKYKNVDQYAPIQKKFITSEDPIQELRMHIMVGDVGDGIPNFKSPDDVFVSGKRQTPIHKDDLERWVKESKPELFCDMKMLHGYKRNQELIDLDFIPKEIQQSILTEWDKPFKESRKHLFDYFVKFGLSKLMDSISEF